MKLEVVIYKTKDGKRHTEVLSKNQAMKLMLSKAEGKISGLKIRELSC